MAKVFATEKCFDLTDVCLQLHGGYGYMHETEIERHLRDQRVNRILEGTSEVMRLIISRNILKAWVGYISNPSITAYVFSQSSFFLSSYCIDSCASEELFITIDTFIVS